MAQSPVQCVAVCLRSNRLQRALNLVREHQSDGIGPENMGRLLQLLAEENNLRDVATPAFEQLTEVVVDLPRTVIAQEVILEESRIARGNLVTVF